MPFYQNLMTKQMKNLNNSMQESVLDTIQVLDYSYQIPFEVDRQNTFGTELKSDTSTITLKSNKRSMSFFKKSKYGWKSNTSVLNLPIQYSSTTDAGIFGTKETAVYMTLSDDFCRHRTSSTQATASINKCFQVSNEWMPFSPSTNATSTDYCSSCTIPYHWQKHVIPDELLNTNIYFFGRKKDERKQKGMGKKSQSHTKLQKTSQTSTHALRSKGSDSSTSINKSKDAKFKLIPAKTSKGAATAASTKTVTIKDEKQLKPCPALGGTTKGDMMVTVSHIKIGPKETCPTHGNEPCQGPKCVLASSGEEQGPVKVTTVNNPRRGVFEIVIRKLTGAPLARNELMLEWTPPPSRTPTCSGLCPVPCFPPSPYRPPKCKLIVCRPLSCKPKCCKKKSCGRIPCRTLPCKPRRKYCKTSCCANPCSSCNPCKPCPPPSCGPASCSPPCGRPACTSPCKSSPCLKPCLVGRKRYRKSRSQPKIKSHRKKISPCCNRSRICPVVRCRSVPGPRIKGAPFCLPRKCCSVGLCQPTKSACSSCCG